MEPGQLAFTIPGELGKYADPLPYNSNAGGPAHQRR